MNLDLSKLSKNELRTKAAQIYNAQEFAGKLRIDWYRTYNELSEKRFCTTKKLLQAKINSDHYEEIYNVLNDYGLLILDEQNKRNLA